MVCSCVEGHLPKKDLEKSRWSHKVLLFPFSLHPPSPIFRVRKQNWLLKVTWMNINSWKCHVAPGIIPNKPWLIWKNCSLKKNAQTLVLIQGHEINRETLISEGFGSGPLVAMTRMMVCYNKSFLDSCFTDACKVLVRGERKEQPSAAFKWNLLPFSKLFETMIYGLSYYSTLNAVPFLLFSLSLFSFFSKFRNTCNYLEQKEWISCAKDF